jgi:hypothetical protein
MKSGWGMIRLSRVVTCGVVMLLWIPVNLFGREISLEAAVAIAVEKKSELAVAANKLLVARGELQRANYISQCNPELVSDGATANGTRGARRTQPLHRSAKRTASKPG